MVDVVNESHGLLAILDEPYLFLSAGHIFGNVYSTNVQCNDRFYAQ